MRLYEHIGVAVAFSPRLQPLLSEVARHVSRFRRRLSLIHVGTPTDEKKTRLREAVQSAGLSDDTPVHWVEGTREEAILRVVEEEDVDLLVTGALEKVSPFRYYVGSLARDLVRHAPCSLFLFTEPNPNPKPFQRIVVVTDFSEASQIAFAKALWLAEQESAEQVYVLRAVSSYGEAIRRTEGYHPKDVQENIREERQLLEDFVDAAGHLPVDVQKACVSGHSGSVTASFVRKHRADLLVMPSTSQHHHFFERLFPSDMEWVLREIPCNLWIARS